MTTLCREHTQRVCCITTPIDRHRYQIWNWLLYKYCGSSLLNVARTLYYVKLIWFLCLVGFTCKIVHNQVQDSIFSNTTILVHFILNIEMTKSFYTVWWDPDTQLQDSVAKLWTQSNARFPFPSKTTLSFHFALNIVMSNSFYTVWWDPDAQLFLTNQKQDSHFPPKLPNDFSSLWIL